ncbi:hypothetical protein DQ401_18785 [Morganella morganii]|nr:hypothetical protein DQ401_18785 [Morganella morganii]
MSGVLTDAHQIHSECSHFCPVSGRSVNQTAECQPLDTFSVNLTLFRLKVSIKFLIKNPLTFCIQIFFTCPLTKCVKCKVSIKFKISQLAADHGAQ